MWSRIEQDFPNALVNGTMDVYHSAYGEESLLYMGKVIFKAEVSRYKNAYMHKYIYKKIHVSISYENRWSYLISGGKMKGTKTRIKTIWELKDLALGWKKLEVGLPDQVALNSTQFFIGRNRFC